jgi:cyclopropane fatty-acyl-phospholipid synthase-like methyltransferase
MRHTPHPRPPVDPAVLNADPAEMWTNLGDWRETATYAEAARGLATRVGERAGLGPRDVVVDYACGFGDSLRLWVEAFDVRRAVGIEPDPDVCETVRARVARWGLTSRIEVVASRAELCPATRAAPDVTAVVCVDAAYHFRSRLDWWRMLAQQLPDGARIATCDLVLADNRRAGPLTHAIAAAFGIPRENLYDAATLHRALEASGLAEVRIESVGSRVLRGFAAHAPSRNRALRLTKLGIRTLWGRGRIDYLLASGVVARRADVSA